MTNLRRIIVAVTILLCTAVQAYALSDKDYGRMMRDDNFSQADKNLNSAWSEAKSSLTPSQFNALKKDQSQWIKKTRDTEAAKLMKQGLSMTEAYTAATNARADYIRTLTAGNSEDPYDSFVNAVTRIADSISKGKPTMQDGSSRIWKGKNYVLAKSGKYIAEFFTADGAMTFPGGIKLYKSSDYDVRKFFGEDIRRNDEGIYYTGGIHQWVEFDTRTNDLLTSIHFVQADATLTDKASRILSDYISELQ